MIGWLLSLDETQRKAVIDNAEQIAGIPAKAIEKDWWVTLTLKALFQSAYNDKIVFKGGTSLSKCWNLIARFSEDIDISLDPETFGKEYIDNPTKTYVKRLKRAGCIFTSNEFKQELENQLLALGVPKDFLIIEAEPIPELHPDTDPQVIYVKYPSLYPPNPYIADQVKIEVSVRSLKIPFTGVEIQSLLQEHNPNDIYAEKPFTVQVVESRKTFLEKMFLLHEEFAKPDKTRIRTERMSRHLYDLTQMMDTNVGTEALGDHDLYNTLVQHRQWYSNISTLDYTTMERESLSFIPVTEVLDAYKKDYNTRQEEMIYQEAAGFDEILARLKALQERLKAKE